MEKYGLIGYPLGHSFSKKYFSEKFEKENKMAQYELYEIENIATIETIKKDKLLKGLNVTIPYKEKIIPYLNQIDPIAQQIGAINTIKITHQPDNQTILKGYNTDVIGFINSLKTHLKPHHTQALILGTGGVSKAIQYILTRHNIKSTLVSRNKSNQTLTYDQIDKKVLQQHTLIINGTPVGMHPHIDQCPQIPYHLLDQRHLLFDTIYNPKETLFIKKGKAQNCSTVNGLEMLIGQAEAAWQIWQQ